MRKLKKLAVELSMQMHAIKGTRSTTTDAETANYILKATASALEIDGKRLVGGCRKRELAEARFIVAYLVKKNTSLTLKQIGQLIGNRDHSTAMYAIETAEDLANTDKQFLQKLQLVQKAI